MKKIVLLMVAVLLMISGITCANPWQRIVFTWDAPTTYTDGSPLEAGDISHYILRCGDAPDYSDVTINVGNMLTYDVSDDLPAGMGLVKCVVEVYSVANITGGFSNEASKSRVGKTMNNAENLR